MIHQNYMTKGHRVFRNIESANSHLIFAQILRKISQLVNLQLKQVITNLKAKLAQYLNNICILTIADSLNMKLGVPCSVKINGERNVKITI